MSDDQVLLGNPLPDYQWPDLRWIPLPIWIGMGLEAVLLGFLVARKLVRR